MNIFTATQQFEQWLTMQLPLVRQDVLLKHALMAEARSRFFARPSTAGCNSGRRCVAIWQKRLGYLAWATCISRTLAPGATRKAG
jgi:hypothetical protein